MKKKMSKIVKSKWESHPKAILYYPAVNFEMYLQFFQKMNEKIRLNYYGTSSRIVFWKI